jgi:hypothetical protein
LQREGEVEDTSDGRGQDSEEEEELELQHEEEEEEHEEEGTTRTRWWGVMDLPQDPHPHADIGLATSFALL